MSEEKWLCEGCNGEIGDEGCWHPFLHGLDFCSDKCLQKYINEKIDNE